MKLRVNILLVILFMLNCFTGFSKGIDSTKNFTVETNFHTGFLLPHKKKLKYFNQRNNLVFQLSVFKENNTNSEWCQAYNSPRIGLSLLLIQYPSKETLGNGFGVFPFIDFPLNKKRSLFFRGGYGIGYVQKPFDLKENTKNIVIGSKLNGLVYFNTHYKLKLKEKFNLGFGLSFIHLSNGSFKLPNLGLNMVTFEMGLSYKFGKNESFLKKKKIETISKKLSYSISSNFSMKEISPIGGPKYSILGLGIETRKKINFKTFFGFGADFFYNNTVPDQLILGDPYATPEEMDKLRIGVRIGYGLTIGRAQFMLQMGGYLKNSLKGDGFLYHRLSTRYMINKHIFANVGLKSHFAVADYFEFGLGYKF